MSVSEESGRQRVRRALAGRPGRLPAVGPLAVHYCAALAGVSLKQYTTDAAVLADCVVQYWETFRPDAVWLSADTWVTAEAMGAAVAFVSDDQPMGGTGAPAIQSAGDIDRIPPPDPASQGRCPLMLEAISRLRGALGDETFLVACFDQYPFSLACALMGIDALMLKLVDDPPFVTALLERCTEYTTAYARMLAAHGADMLSGGDSPAVMLGPEYYRQIAWPAEQRVIRELQVDTKLPISLHICGDTTPILAPMSETGADVLELDHLVDLGQAAEAAGPGVALWGNLDPVGLLARGSTDQIRGETRRTLDRISTLGHPRFVLSSGCTLPVETPAENLRAMIDTAHER